MSNLEKQPGTAEQEIARRILGVFKNRRVRRLKVEQLRDGLLEDPQFRDAAFEDGAKYAIQQGWLGFIGDSDVRLLDPGAKV